MITQRPTQQNPGFVDQAAQAADDAIKATQRIADDALDGLAGSVQDARRKAGPMIERASDHASELAQRGVNALHDTTKGLHDGAVQATERASLYVKEEPLKAILIAAATGAALMALIGLLTRSRHRV